MTATDKMTTEAKRIIGSLPKNAASARAAAWNFHLSATVELLRAEKCGDETQYLAAYERAEITRNALAEAEKKFPSATERRVDNMRNFRKSVGLLD